MTHDDSLDYNDLPPFPTDVPTAPLLRLSLQKLINSDASELDRLWEACCNVGFFYLDLRGASDPVQNGHSNGPTNGETNGAPSKTGLDGNVYLADAAALFPVQQDLYDLPVEEKIKYDFKDQGSYFGYKGYGHGIVDAKGTKDRNEFYNISKDDILHLSPQLPAPPAISSHRPLYKTFITQSHAIITLLLSHLNTHLHLPPRTLQDLHDLYTPSGDQIRFVRAPPQPATDRGQSMGAHTDFGSVTLLFNRLGGLQILPPESDDVQNEEQKSGMWQYVRPLRGHCVVNLGDAMVKFTRGVLRSNVHRVVNPPGGQGDMTRLSLVYFSRPTDGVVLRALGGSDVVDARRGEGQEEGEEEEITAKEWTLRRALGRRGRAEDFGNTLGTEGQRGIRKQVGGQEVRGMREVAVDGS